jgi:stress-induced-phosphoprotein 1
LKKAEKIQKEEAAKKYINPEIAEQHKKKGDELFKEGKFPAAIKEYDEAVRRDP